MSQNFILRDESRPSKDGGAFDEGAFERARHQTMAKYRARFRQKGPGAALASCVMGIKDPPDYLPSDRWSAFVDDIVAVNRAGLLDGIGRSFEACISDLSGTVAGVSVIRKRIEPVAHKLQAVEERAKRSGVQVQDPSNVEPLVDVAFYRLHGTWPDRGLTSVAAAVVASP